MLVGLVRDVRAGFFNNHGEAFRAADHPIAFWLWLAFAGILGLAGLYYAVFGDHDRPN
jgi:hypothetical protein